MATKKVAAKAAAKPAAKPAAKKAAKVVVPTTKGAILAEIATKAGITKAQAEAAYDTLLAIAYAGAKQPAGITLPGLAKLSVGKRAARMASTPRPRKKSRVPPPRSSRSRLSRPSRTASSSSH